MDLAQTLKQESRFKTVFLVLGLSLLFGLIALIKIPLPFSPIPMVFTVQAVLLASALFGRKATYAVGAYLAEGLMGLPVFAGGNSGLAYFMGPTGGYLVGFLIASFVVAMLTEKFENRTPARLFLILLSGNALVFVFGLPHLALFVGSENALRMGLYPFVGFDVLKLLLGTQLIRKRLA